MESPYKKVLRAAEARRKRIVSLYDDGKGMPKSDIARKFKISHQRVGQILAAERAK